MKLYLVVTVIVGHPAEIVGVLTYWPLNAFGVTALHKYHAAMCDKTLEFFGVVVPVLLLCLLLKEIALTLMGRPRINWGALASLKVAIKVPHFAAALVIVGFATTPPQAQWDADRPGAALANLLRSINNYETPVDFGHAIEAHKRNTFTPEEARLHSLAADVIPCVVSYAPVCELKGNLARYGEWKPLAGKLALNMKNPDHVGSLFVCAVQYLQGLKTRDEYQRCIR